ncbi:MAG: zinc ABC transporter substrate-binding protein [Pseudomonadota bacterium]|nr:zinc ABC transporter substrate-binding protein [Pseudomonadota bacterium]
MVTILPQAYFVERIGGPHVEVTTLVGEGQSPHGYEPTPRQMARLAEARAYFLIGAPVERAVLGKIEASHRKIEIVATQRGVPYRYPAGEGHGHEGNDAKGQPPQGREKTGGPAYGEGRTAARGGEAAGKPGTAPHPPKDGQAPDPHIWLDPRLVKIQARNIHAALCRLDPAHRQEYGANLRAFQADLDRVDARIARALAPLKGKRMYVYHPAFGYFAAAYGLIQVPVEWGGREPSARRLASLIAAARRDGVKVIFVQAQFPAKSAAAVARAIGGAVAPIDPLARDYLDNLNRIAAAVEQGLGQ